MKPEREDELIERHLKKRIAQGLNECEVTPEEQEELDRGFAEYLAREKARGRA